MSCVICCESLFDNIYELGESLEEPSSGRPQVDRSNHNWADRPSVLTCGHVFHQGCISAWLAQSNRGTCPTCRNKHSGEAIAMYFDAEVEDGVPVLPGSRQVRHRNKVIKTLCANIESALADVKASNERLDKANAQYKALEQEHANGVENAKIMKVRASGFRKSANELKTQNMKLEAIIAEQARQIDELKTANATLGAQLDEQKRVVETMGDIRGTNEKLMRALKAERARVETQATLNTQLANRIAAFEQATMPSVEAGESTATDDSATAASQGISQIELTENASDPGSESVEEDARAVCRSINLPRQRPNKTSAAAVARRSAKFELPVAAFDNAESSTEAKSNPFAASPVQVMKFEPPSIAFFVPPGKNELVIREPLVASNRPAQGRVIRALRRPTKNLATMSDGMGGSTQYGNKRLVSSVQSKINWGPKK
ncbi:hypothetical protein IWW37_002551 [Coemansia sp. RSA 2050]|nr:hypothetical protein IWW37_002551 [Coemansia sp. RSA 2050]KAJ2734551.1 hypothetical protein IW152_002208 [Coemansia sp. BCRC 34962]